MYYNCVKFHKNSISSLVGVALTRYMPPPPFHESISWIISPFKFWIATIFLHAHPQVVYYKCVKFHKNPISGLGGVALTRYMDGRTGRFLYTLPNSVCGGYKNGQPPYTFVTKILLKVALRTHNIDIEWVHIDNKKIYFWDFTKLFINKSSNHDKAIV